MLRLLTVTRNRETNFIEFDSQIFWLSFTTQLGQLCHSYTLLRTVHAVYSRTKWAELAPQATDPFDVISQRISRRWD